MSKNDEEILISSISSLWEDIIIPPELSNSTSIININHKPNRKNALDLFTVLYINNEISERSYLLTKEIINYNPSNYTAWMFLRKILSSQPFDIEFELDYIKRLIRSEPKNYQVWYHYRWLIKQNSNFNIDSNIEKELNFHEEMLLDDAKNFNVWSQRKWMIETFKLPWIDQLEFTRTYIEDDFRNNSVWNFRYNTILQIFSTTNNTFGEQEAEFCLEILRLDYSNECIYTYLFSIIKLYPSIDIKNLLNNINDLIGQNVPPRSFLSFQVDIYTLTSNFSQMINVCKILSKIDPIRKNYWEWKVEMAEQLQNENLKINSSTF